jgi:hypothetical protein
MSELPPDLDALGEALTRAASASERARRRRVALRRRVAICAVAGLAVFAMTTPSPLGTGVTSTHLQLASLSMTPLDSSMGCDRPHGGGAELSDGCSSGEPQPQAAR